MIQAMDMLRALDYDIALRVSRSWDQLMEYRAVNGGRCTQCYFIFSPDGQLVREVVEDTLELDDYIRMAAERQAGCVIGYSYAGCIASTEDQSTEELFFEEYMQPQFIRISEGLLAGEVVGPLHGLGELGDFVEYMREHELAPRTYAWYDLADVDGFELLTAHEPWSRVEQIMG